MRLPITALRDGNQRGLLVFNWMSEAIDLAREQKCAGLGWPQLEQLIGAARQNVAAGEKPRFRQDLLDLEGRIALAKKDFSMAKEKFDGALALDPRAEVALQQTALLASNGLPQKRWHLAFIDDSPPGTPAKYISAQWRMHAWLLWKDGYWDDEIAHMHDTLIEDLDSIVLPQDAASVTPRVSD